MQSNKFGSIKTLFVYVQSVKMTEKLIIMLILTIGWAEGNVRRITCSELSVNLLIDTKVSRGNRNLKNKTDLNIHN